MTGVAYQMESKMPVVARSANGFEPHNDCIKLQAQPARGPGGDRGGGNVNDVMDPTSGVSDEMQTLQQKEQDGNLIGRGDTCLSHCSEISLQTTC